MLILCTAVYVAFLLIDVVSIIKNKQWKLLTIYSILFIIAYTLTVLLELGIKIPSPAVPLKELVLSIVGE